MSPPTWPEGVTGLDHTADAGLSVRAPTLEELFDRAAAGMLALVGGADEGSTIHDPRSTRGPGTADTSAEPDVPGAADSASRRLELDAPDLEALLVTWLREVLFLFQVRQFEYAAARFDVLSDTRLVARVRGRPAARPALELKGVTYHALTVRREDGGWFARIVFDV